MSLDARPDSERDPEREPSPIPDDERLTGAERELINALRSVTPVAPTFTVSDVARRAELERMHRSVWQWRAIAAVLLVALGAALGVRPEPTVVERVVIQPAPEMNDALDAPRVVPSPRVDRMIEPIVLPVDTAPSRVLSAVWRTASDSLDDSAVPRDASGPAPYPSDRSAQLRYGRGVLSVHLVGSAGDPL